MIPTQTDISIEHDTTEAYGAWIELMTETAEYVGKSHTTYAPPQPGWKPPLSEAGKRYLWARVRYYRHHLRLHRYNHTDPRPQYPQVMAEAERLAYQRSLIMWDAALNEADVYHLHQTRLDAKRLHPPYGDL